MTRSVVCLEGKPGGGVSAWDGSGSYLGHIWFLTPILTPTPRNGGEHQGTK